jgi:hypothetical protein
MASHKSLMDPTGKKEEEKDLGGHGGTVSQRQ